MLTMLSRVLPCDYLSFIIVTLLGDMVRSSMFFKMPLPQQLLHSPTVGFQVLPYVVVCMALKLVEKVLAIECQLVHSLFFQRSFSIANVPTLAMKMQIDG